jgi:transcription elongation factor GreA
MPVRVGGAGVFVVELPAPQPTAPLALTKVGKWIEHAPDLRLDGERPASKELLARLASFWLPDQAVLYIDGSSSSIGGRIAAMLRTELGDRRPYAGGHWLKALTSLDDLRIWWAPTDAVEESLLELTLAFADGVDPSVSGGLPDTSVILPFANLVSPTGDRKKHGISGALVDNTPPPPALGTTVVAGTARRTTARPGATPAGSRTRAAKAPAPPPSRPAEPTYLTQEGLDRVRDELHELVQVRRPAVVARIRAARELGDLRENAEYHAAREEQSFLEGRIQALEARLRGAVLVEAEASPSAILGSTVVVETEAGEQRYLLVGSADANPAEGRISVASPVGKALLGHHPGDEVEVRTPAGSHSYRIVEVI